MTTLEDMKQLIEKAAKYDAQKGRYTELAAKVAEANKILKEVMAELDPTVTINTRSNKKEAITTALERLRDGREFTFDQLNELVGGTDNQARYVWQKLRETKGVEARADKLDPRAKVLYWN